MPINHVIFEETSPSDYLFLLAHGIVEIRKDLKNTQISKYNKNVSIKMVSEGEFFGFERGMLKEQPRIYSAVAVSSETTIYKVELKTLVRPEFASVFSKLEALGNSEEAMRWLEEKE